MRVISATIFSRVIANIPRTIARPQVNSGVKRSTNQETPIITWGPGDAIKPVFGFISNCVHLFYVMRNFFSFSRNGQSRSPLGCYRHDVFNVFFRNVFIGLKYCLVMR